MKQKSILERSYSETRREDVQRTNELQREISRLNQDLIDAGGERQKLESSIDLISQSDKLKNETLRRVVEAHEVSYCSVCV